MLKEDQPQPEDAAATLIEVDIVQMRIVTAKRPGHVWHVDLTTVPTGGGFWVPWLPHTWPQSWPFCWWVAVVVDHFSRAVVGFAVFTKRPNSLDVQRFPRSGYWQLRGRAELRDLGQGNPVQGVPGGEGERSMRRPMRPMRFSSISTAAFRLHVRLSHTIVLHAWVRRDILPPNIGCQNGRSSRSKHENVTRSRCHPCGRQEQRKCRRPFAHDLAR